MKFMHIAMGIAVLLLVSAASAPVQAYTASGRVATCANDDPNDPLSGIPVEDVNVYIYYKTWPSQLNPAWLGVVKTNYLGKWSFDYWVLPCSGYGQIVAKIVPIPRPVVCHQVRSEDIPCGRGILFEDLYLKCGGIREPPCPMIQ